MHFPAICLATVRYLEPLGEMSYLFLLEVG